MTTKVKLDLDSLEVQSFSTADDDSGHRGTVHANEGTTEASNGSACQDLTCYYGCWYGQTEGGTCTCDPGATLMPCCIMMQ